VYGIRELSAVRHPVLDPVCLDFLYIIYWIVGAEYLEKTTALGRVLAIREYYTECRNIYTAYSLQSNH
jgi:hypothetical protein